MSTIRVCPMRDAACPHGLDCPYVGDGPYGYPCKEGWKLSKTDIELREEYLRMLRLPYTSSERLSGQTRMCILRDAIARQERRDPESVQVEYEQRAGQGPTPEPLSTGFERAEIHGEPVAWQHRYIGQSSVSAWRRDWYPCPAGHENTSSDYEYRPLYAHPDPAVERLQRELEEVRICLVELETQRDSAEASLAKAREALRQIAEHKERDEGVNGDNCRWSYSIGWAFHNCQSIARAALKERTDG